MSLSVISVPPVSGKPTAGLLAVLHGFGGNAQELASLAPVLNLPDYQLMFANAPFPHSYTSTGKMWYDLGRSQDAPQQLAQSRQLLTEWLTSLESATGIPLSRTVLCGFSQGGAMTLDVGLNLPLGGLVVLSGYLHPVSQRSDGGYPPVLIAHGTQDTIVPLSSAQKAREALTALGVSVRYQEFNMGHYVLPEELQVVQNFVLEVTSNVKK